MPEETTALLDSFVEISEATPNHIRWKGHKQMQEHKDKLDKYRRKVEKAIEQQLADDDPLLIQAGADALRRDLPQLIQADKEFHMVAYLGSKQLAVAPDYRSLKKELRRIGYKDEKGMLITDIVPSETSGRGR